MPWQVLAIQPKAAQTNLQLEQLRRQLDVAHHSLERYRAELMEMEATNETRKQTSDTIETQVRARPMPIAHVLEYETAYLLLRRSAGSSCAHARRISSNLRGGTRISPISMTAPSGLRESMPGSSQEAQPCS